jgi:hypothetical protein
LSRPDSPYLNNEISVTRYSLPGRSIQIISMETESVLRYIRSLPPPVYKLPPCSYS